MPVFKDYAVQVWPYHNFRAFRRPCGNDQWLNLKDGDGGFFSLLIVGATAAEIDAIMSAFNAPIERMKAERAQLASAAE